MRYLWIGLGGAVGSMVRYAIGINVDQAHFPWATFAVNVSGSFLLGLLLTVGVDRLPEDVVMPLAVGVLGGYTTFSTFAWEGFTLGRTGRVNVAIAYVAASMLGGLVAACGGFLLGRALR